MIQDDRLTIKEAYLNYLEEVPIHKWASKAVKKTEETMKRWRDEDADFQDQCEARMSKFVRSNLKRARSEFKLERILKDDFAERKELANPPGQTLQINIIAYGVHDPLPVRSTSVHGASPSRPAPVSSPELASESSQDNAGNQ